jgi:flavorubredoxin
MDAPTLYEPQKTTSDIYVLPSFFPIPVLGILPVNAFLLMSKEPVLIDTGLVPLSDGFMEALAGIVDLQDLKWLWLTHTDQDHIGSLWPLLAAAPDLKVITTFLGMGKMSVYRPLPPERVYLLNPGQTLNVGDRVLTAVKPPTYDAPETTGLFDPASGTYFSVDSFGALMTEPAFSADDIPPDQLEYGLRKWGTIDAPWAHLVPPGLFRDSLAGVRKMSPKWILSSHLPPAKDMTDNLIDLLAKVPESEPFVGPDQQALEEMMSQQGG